MYIYKKFFLKIFVIFKITFLIYKFYKIYALNNYLYFIYFFNKKYKLTSLINLEIILINIFLDSILSVFSASLNFNFDFKYKVCDLGSGFGVPGLIISIIVPKWKIFCIDFIEKNFYFLKFFRNNLQIKNLIIINSKIEILIFQNFDLIFSRAFSSLYKIVLYSSKHTSKICYIISMKGKFIYEEIKYLDLLKYFCLNNIIFLNLFYKKYQRCLIEIKNIN